MPERPLSPDERGRRAEAWNAALRYAAAYALVLGAALVLAAWTTRSASIVASVFGALAGAPVASFINQAVYRWPRAIPLDDPPSSCPACRTPIRPGDNVPVLGWLRLRGRCRHCSIRIPLFYPIVELAGAITGAAISLQLFRALVE